jgi:hypothetical protein
MIRMDHTNNVAVRDIVQYTKSMTQSLKIYIKYTYKYNDDIEIGKLFAK